MKKAIFVPLTMVLIILIFVVGLFAKSKSFLSKDEFLHRYIVETADRFCAPDNFAKFDECIDFPIHKCIALMDRHIEDCVNKTIDKLPNKMNYAHYESAQQSYTSVMDFCVGREAFLELSDKLPHEQLSCMWGVSQALQGKKNTEKVKEQNQ